MLLDTMSQDNRRLKLWVPSLGLKERFINGVIHCFQIGTIKTDSIRRYRLSISPQFEALKYGSNCQFFKDITVPEIFQSQCNSQFIPRIGQEVLVSYVGGDIDMPMVLGAVTNGTTASTPSKAMMNATSVAMTLFKP